MSDPLASKPLFYRPAVDVRSTPALLGHIMDLGGPWSLVSSLSSNAKAKRIGFSAHAVLPLNSNPDSNIHGYYISPSYFYSDGSTEGNLNTLGFTGWQLSLGRANLSFPKSAFRGFLQLSYRDLRVNNDSTSKDISRNFLLDSKEETRRSIIILAGASTTQNGIINQKRPLLDSELLISGRYDYDSEDFFTLLRSSIFYPTWVDLGASLAWHKSYRDEKSPLFDEVSDNFVFGPRFRGRAFDQLAFDVSLEWHSYRTFDGQLSIPPARVLASAILNF